MTDAFPARLHVLMARDALDAVVIRRGPSKQTCTIRWDRKSDAFSLGQWLKGRIYERRCDISPDGKHLIYFAMDGKWQSETGGSWTAISRVPYLKAVGLWGKGDCWNGGGLFVSDTEYWINDGYGHTAIREPPDLLRVESHDGQNQYGGECPGVYFIRLQRDGWRMIGNPEQVRRAPVTVFEKPLRYGWILRKLARATIKHPPGKGCYYDEHELENIESGKKLALPNWEWADLDRNRLVWCEAGKLMAARVEPEGLQEPAELYDFNAMQFEPIRAPY